jgi:hypothetical protein
MTPRRPLGPGPRPRGGSEPPASSPAQQAEAAGPVYGQLVNGLLDAEERRKNSFEQRGIAVISTSAVLVSLLFALAAVVTRSQDFVVPDAARALLVLALVLFLVAGVAGIVANYPVRYELIALPDLERLVQPEAWEGDAAVAGRRIAEVSVKVLAVARAKNELKGKALVAGMVAEVAAVTVVAASVAVILLKD